MEADAVEIRVLGCLVEKQRTTPDVYPLTLNALRLACNQATNRDPVVDYDEPTIRAAIERLQRKQWARLASGPSSRAIKYRHLLDDALHLSGEEISVLAVLMLRGPQTLGELKARTERLHRFESLSQVQETLASLIEREYVERMPRRPGAREERYRQLLGGDSEPAAPSRASDNSSQADDGVDGEPRVTRLSDDAAEPLSRAIEARVRRLEEMVESLVESIESMRREP